MRKVVVGTAALALVLAATLAAFQSRGIESTAQRDDVAWSGLTIGTLTLFHSPEEVKRAFRDHGLPLREQRQRRALEGVRSFLAGGAGQVFQVDVYPTLTQADASDDLIVTVTTGGEPRGRVRVQVKANVRVIYDDGRPLVRKRFRAALAALGP